MYENTTKSDRNKFVIAHLVAGKSLREVQDALVSAGHGKIDTTRIWKIWKQDPQFVGKRDKERICAFCLERKMSSTMYSMLKDNKIWGKMCEDCWNKRPEPIK